MAFHAAKIGSRTCILRPASANHRKIGRPWATGNWRLSRTLDTVVLADDQKELIIKDIEEYLRPHTRQWYAERGIPYRRGYVSIDVSHLYGSICQPVIY